MGKISTPEEGILNKAAALKPVFYCMNK